MQKTKKGFTLIELLVVVAILAIISIMVIFALLNNLAKGRDTKRKADLARLKTAFEEYYGDKSIYPDPTILSNCNGQDLRPYLSTIPCDPRTKQPYCYIYDADHNGQNYKILTSFEYSGDPITSELDCADNPDYCGYEKECGEDLGLGSKFDYGVSSSNVVVNREIIGGGELSTPTPLPSTIVFPSTLPGSFACTPGTANSPSQCDNYDIVRFHCPLSFSIASECEEYCPTSPVEARCSGE